MDHGDHVRLLHNGIPGPGGLWADFGSGTGAFTLALADLIGPDGEIISIDQNRGALHQQEQAIRARFPAVTVHYRAADFTGPLDLPPLDGIVMANSLHFIRDKLPVLNLIKSYLAPGGRLILVEYDTDQGNRWVPYPLSYRQWEALAGRAGFLRTTAIATRASSFLGRFYAALSVLDNPGEID
jgi:ubiquinone/menaquinone biosynthesis C-methylase UbiE